MATRTIANGGGNWNSTGTWVEGAIPTASDDVVATATSGQVTVDAASACRSIDLTGYTNTLTHNTFTLTIGTSTAGPGNVALKFPTSGWTYSISLGGGTLSFNSTVASTTQTVDFGNKTTRSLSFLAATTSGYQLVNNGVTVGTGNTVTLNQGTLNTNGQTCSWGAFISTSGTRTLTLGASSITLTGNAAVSNATVWNTTNSSGTMTITSNTATITCNGTGTAALPINFNTATAQNFNGASLVISGAGPAAIGFSCTFASFTRAGTAAQTDSLSLGSGTLTVTGTCTLTGNSLVNRLLVNSNTPGTARIINAAAVSLTNVDFADITGAGAATWSGSSLGDAQGNSNITFTTPTTRYGVNSTGSWNSTTRWATSSGGSSGATIPLCHDTVIIDSNCTGTFSVNMPRIGKDVTCVSGYTGTLNFNNQANAIYGNLTLVAGMSGTFSTGLTYSGRGAGQTITTAGFTMQSSNISAPGGTYSLQDNFTSGSTLTVSDGTLNANGFNVTCTLFTSNLNHTRAITMGSGTWTVNGTGSVWNISNTGTLTLTPGTSTLVVSDTSATAKTFVGAGLTYNALTVSGDNVTVSGANTFAILNVNTAGLTTGLVLTSSVTQTITNSFTTNGSAGNLAKLSASTPGTAATLSKASGIVGVDYMSIKDSAATGGATWYAGANSTNVSGNSGWIFTAAPGGAGTRLALLGVG